MNIKCQYSGITFKVEHFNTFNSTKQNTFIHPIFQLETRQLLYSAQNWRKSSFSETEQKLFFLALLNKTDAIIWKHPASPSLKIINRNIVPLIKLMGAKDIIQHQKIQLPKYTIVEETCELLNLHNWINAWQDAKKDALDPLKRNLLDFGLENSIERILDRLLGNPNKSLEDIAGRLYVWAMSQLDGLSASKKEEYKECFLFTDNQLMKLSSEKKAKIASLLELLEVELYATGYGSNYADATLALIRKKLKKAYGGLMGELGGFDLLETMTDFHSLRTEINKEKLQGNFQSSNTLLNILNSRLPREVKVSQDLAQGAPEDKPRKENFKTLVEYMKAKSAWAAAQRVNQLTPKLLTNDTEARS